VQSGPAQQRGVRLFPIVVAHLDFEERRKAADKHYAKHDVVRSLQDERREQCDSDHAQDEQRQDGVSGRPREGCYANARRAGHQRTPSQNTTASGLGTMTPTAQNA
jgi:hypothetical protein